MSGVAVAAAGAARSLGAALDAVLARPRAVVATLAAAQVALTAILALSATHNGWVWFQGGDQIWFTSDASVLGALELPPGEVSLGWPLVLTPFTWLTGPTFVQAMPLVVALNVLVLGPLALWCVHDLASRIGGRALGLWAGVLWVVAPYAAIPLFVERYHERWVDQFLPQGLGLTAMADYPSMVVVLVAAACVARSLDTRAWTDATLAGLAFGAAGLVKPPNFLFAVGAALAYLVARRWRLALVFGGAAAVGVLTLAVFKHRALGDLPLFSLEEARLAAGEVVAINLDRYLPLDLDHWSTQMNQLREYFWSARLFQWAPLAGLVAVLRFRPAHAALLGGWLGAFVLVKGTAPAASIEANTFWRLLMPAWPAYLLLLASIPLLVPTLARRLGSRVEGATGSSIRIRTVAVVAVGAAALPLAVAALWPPLDGPDRVVIRPERDTIVLTPVVPGLRPRIERVPEGVRIAWEPGSWRAGVSYRVYENLNPDTDTVCFVQGASRVQRCTLTAPEPVAATRGTEWVDTTPSPGGLYRVGVAVRYDDAVDGADVFALSPPVSAPS